MWPVLSKVWENHAASKREISTDTYEEAQILTWKLHQMGCLPVALLHAKLLIVTC